MKKSYIVLIAFVLICLNFSAQFDNVPIEENSRSFFFDSIVPVWVAPKSAYFKEVTEKEWDSCQGKYVCVKKQIWVNEVPGYYKNVSKLYLNDNGKISLATNDVLENEMNKNLNTKKLFTKVDRRNKTFGIGATFFLSGLLMMVLPAGLELPILYQDNTYFITSVSLLVAGGIILASSNRNMDYYQNKAIKQYNANNGITKKWSFKPNLSLLNGKLNSSFRLAFRF